MNHTLSVTLLIATVTVLTGCTLSGAPRTSSDIWRENEGKRFRRELVYAAPGVVSSPSIIFRGADDGEYTLMEVGHDYITMRGAGYDWVIPLGIVQLRRSRSPGLDGSKTSKGLIPTALRLTRQVP